MSSVTVKATFLKLQHLGLCMAGECLALERRSLLAEARLAESLRDCTDHGEDVAVQVG